MYLFERLRITYIFSNCLLPFFKKIFIYNYLHANTCSTLRKKIKNKAHIKVSICKAYIVEEIWTFISYYFEPHSRTKINRIPRNNDSGELTSSENLLIFFHLIWLLSKNAIRSRYLTDIEFKKAHNYLLLNCHKLAPFV